MNCTCPGQLPFHAADCPVYLERMNAAIALAIEKGWIQEVTTNEDEEKN